MEQGRHLLAEDRLAGREQQWGEQRTEQAIHRTHKEDRAVQQAARRKQQQERQRSAAMEEQERRRQHTMLEAKRSHERHNKFLKETMSKYVFFFYYGGYVLCYDLWCLNGFIYFHIEKNEVF